jgi:hypothetical protein
MRVRCPSAKPVGSFLIAQARLVFRSVADIDHDETFKVPVGVWSITREDEAALDRYEGAGRVYDRQHLRIGDEDALIYMMRDRGIAPPGARYLEIIRKGYDDFGLDHAYLDAALEHAFSDAKRITDQIRDRRERNPSRHGNVVTKVVKKPAKKKAQPRKAIPQEQRVVTAPAWQGESRLIKKGTK